jgi:mono/diheme cytochrome c family protein
VIEAFYAYLNQMGYSHPLHPAMTHLPLGMSIGAFLFGLSARYLRKPALVATARHCTMLAFMSLPPTVILGIMDWKHFYGGAWLFPLRMKILLASILAVILLICLFLERRADVMRRTLLFFLTLTVLTSAALGYFGGELVFAVRKAPASDSSVQSREGADAFGKSCASCHPRGENPFKPELAPKTAPQLKDFQTFLVYLRAPRARDGSNTMMPPFSEVQLPEAEAKAIYQYIVKVLKDH